MRNTFTKLLTGLFFVGAAAASFTVRASGVASIAADSSYALITISDSTMEKDPLGNDAWALYQALTVAPRYGTDGIAFKTVATADGNFTFTCGLTPDEDYVDCSIYIKKSEHTAFDRDQTIVRFESKEDAPTLNGALGNGALTFRSFDHALTIDSSADNFVLEYNLQNRCEAGICAEKPKL